MQRRDKTAVLAKTILIVAVPASIQFIVSFIQVTTDMAFIGRYNPLGLSAIQTVRSSYVFLLSFLVAFTNGTRILVARTLGAKRPRRGERVAETSLLYNQVVSIGYLLFWQLGGRFLLQGSFLTATSGPRNSV